MPHPLPPAPDYAALLNSSADRDSLRLIQRLTSVATALSAEKNQERLLEMILVEAQTIAEADGGTLYIRTEEETLEYAILRTQSLGIAYGGTSGTKAPLQPLRMFDSQTGEPNLSLQAVYAVLKQQPVNISDVYAADDFDASGTKIFDSVNNYRTRSVITVPMINHKNVAIGCLQLINACDPATGKTVAFSGQIVEVVLALASQAAVILDNRQLIEGQKNLLESFIQMIAKAIDAKSPYTGAHCERVPLLTNMLAEAACHATEGPLASFNMTDEEKYELHIAGWMHDCGKVTTPVHVMDKSTKLETIFDGIEVLRARWEILKRDTEIEMLKRVQRPDADSVKIQSEFQTRLAELDDEMQFLEQCNIGGEFMRDDDVARLRAISQRQWVFQGKPLPVLTERELHNLTVRRGTMTPEEREIMNGHMVHTCNMLEALPFPKHLKRVPEYAGGHHERMDGKGYPKSIKAGTMSIPARMMAIADVFEALTAADRPYKPAKKLSDSMRIIGEMKRNNHLDPMLVDFFVTSKVYLKFARTYLTPDLIDDVDEAAILAIQPLPVT